MSTLEQGQNYGTLVWKI